MWSNLSNFENENSIGWKRFSIFISFILPIDKSVCFSPFYEAKHFFFPFFFEKKRKTLKINAPNSFFQNEPKFLYIILDFFNKVLKTWSWTSWQKKSVDLDLEDRIWRLEFGKTQFSSFEAAIWRMNFKACTFERLAFSFLGLVEALKSWKLPLLGSEFIRRKRRRLAYSFFHLVRFRPWDSTKTLDFLEEDAAFFLQCEAKIVRRHTS